MPRTRNLSKKASTSITEPPSISSDDAASSASHEATTTEQDEAAESNHHRPQAYTNVKDEMVREDFMDSFRPWHLLDPRRPWVLVPNGSFGGHFDWVPAKYRVGPWSTPAVCYWTGLWYLTLVTGCYYYFCFTASDDKDSWPALQNFSSLEYPAAYSWKWWYHAGGCGWMLYVIYLILVQSPAGYRAWSTYTVLSWTLLTIRHGLCAAIPWYPHSATAAAEWMRFPCALSHTVVFLVWNFVLFPYVAGVVMRDDEKKRQVFLQFCTSFRLLNLHVANLLLCVLNIYWASPPRRLVFLDLYVAAVWLILYMTFYFCALDRLGVHLYPIFSPRSGLMVVVSWTGSIALYLATFYGWRWLLQPQP